MRIRAFSIALTRVLRHDVKVREPMQACDRDFLEMCAREVTSIFHSVLEVHVYESYFRLHQECLGLEAIT